MMICVGAFMDFNEASLFCRSQALVQRLRESRGGGSNSTEAPSKGPLIAGAATAQNSQMSSIN